MRMTEKAAELLMRYRAAVGRCLPMKDRNDISLEIESMILDVCEERYGDSEISELQMASVIEENGKPSTVARRYKKERPLIGPELMPIFKLVLMIVCIVTAVVSLVSLFFSITDMSGSETGLYLLDLFQSLTGAVGSIFIIFVILERILIRKPDFNPIDKAWDVSDLPELKEKLPGRAEIIAGLVFSAIAIIALNIFTERIGIYQFTDSGTVFIPVLTDRILSLIPLFSLRIALGAVVLLPLAAGGRREISRTQNYYYNISRMGLEVFDIGILLMLISRGVDSFLILDNFESAGLTEFLPYAGNLFTGVLLILIGFTAYSIVRKTLVILPKVNV